MKSFRIELIVFAIAAAVLSWNLWNVGIASGSIDPVLHFGAQDEATYTREAIAMATDGHWMTPTFLGRWVFEKPPLLMWMSALSMKVFGIGPLQARLPAVLAGALLCALCFAWVRRERSLPAGIAAGLMALSSQVLLTMSRHNMTDILLAAAGMVAFYVLGRDPMLERRLNWAVFVAAAVGGILAKSVAGVLVLVVMILAQRKLASLRTAVIAVLLASPWFLYNLILHREWFLADMGFQLITTGLAAHQTAQENHVLFYLWRIVLSDAIPLTLAITALVPRGVDTRVRGVETRLDAKVLPFIYAAVYFAALMVFRFHSEQYLCWFVPSLILIGALYSPLLEGRGAWVATAAILLAFIAKLASPGSAWGVSIEPGSTLAAAPVLERYCNERRGNELFVLGVDDEFYSAVLPLARVRYGWVDASGQVSREHPHLAYLGVLVSRDEFARLDGMRATYRERLLQYGLDSDAPVATGISARDPRELASLVAGLPDADFLISRDILPDVPATHRVVFENETFRLMESKQSHTAESTWPAWSCHM